MASVNGELSLKEQLDVITACGWNFTIYGCGTESPAKVILWRGAYAFHPLQDKPTFEAETVEQAIADAVAWATDLKKQLAPRLTDEFLATVTEAAKVCGWDTDHVFTIEFVQWCHEVAGAPVPSFDDLKEYERERKRRGDSNV